MASIRHWHDIGLLPEPARLANNYKHYTAHHPMLAPRIKRLTDLGFSLEQIGHILGSEEHGAASFASCATNSR